MIEESVDDLDSNRPLSEKILLGEIEVKDDIIPVLKLRQMLLSSLEKNEIGTFIVENENIDNGVESYKVVTVLNTQLYNKDGELWLAHQFVNMKDNRVLWSGNYNRLFPSLNSQ